MKTGHTIDEFDWANYYYVQYSDVYHTQQDCPHIQDSDNLVGGRTLSDLNGPYRGGAERVFFTEGDTEDANKCSWCEKREES